MSLKAWQIWLLAFLGIFTVGTGLFIGRVILTFKDLKDVSKLDTYSNYSVPTKIYDIKGNLITEYYLEKRDLVSFNDLPQDLVRAIIATEDSRFYYHKGVNIVAMIQGAVIDPLRGRRARGGSGLTQQLAKLLFTDSSRSVQRKIIEFWYALQIEKKYSKEEILELYFNLIYFGHGQYGIEAASRFYFAKSAKDLSLPEASFLAGLPQAPSRYSPINNYKAAQDRHRVVLNAMANNGYITKSDSDQAFNYLWENYDTTFIAANQNIQNREQEVAGFFTEYVRQQLLARYGEEQLYSGGLAVHTTLDLDYQKIAVSEMETALSREQDIYSVNFVRNSAVIKNNYEDILDITSLALGIDSFTFADKRTRNMIHNLAANDSDLLSLMSFMLGMDKVNREAQKIGSVDNMVARKEDRIEGALISIDPFTGYITSMVGGRNYSVANQFNRATQAYRQVGSTFKPIEFAIAIENKLITPSEIFYDQILSYRLPNGTDWVPRNYDGSYQGAMTVRRALRRSVNIVTIQIWERMIKSMGFDAVLRSIGDFFGADPNTLRRRIPQDLATALGTGIASPLEMARAYSVFANGGMSVEPIAILKVYDRNGQLLDDFQAQHAAIPQKRVISEATAKIMQSLLNDIMERGTASGAARAAGFPTANSGGKTGTTSNWGDAWFTGFTSRLSTVVWIGLDDSRKTLGKSRSSAVVVAPIWMNYMKRAGSINPPGPLAYRQSLEGVKTAFVSSYTGLLTSGDDPDGYLEYFIPGTEPQTYSSPELVAQMRAAENQQMQFQVSGEQVDLATLSRESMPTENPYVAAPETDIDLSFDLSQGL
ncbi:MAG: penicillin-binding protein 1A [Brevinema sp.]